MDGEQQAPEPLQQVAQAIQVLAAQQQEVIAAQRAQQEQLAALSAPRQPAPPQPTFSDLDAANKAVLDQFVQNPLRILGETINRAKMDAVAEAEARIARVEESRRAEEARIAWEREWLAANPDIVGQQKLAFERVLADTDPRRPYNERVEAAANYVRQMSHAERERYNQQQAAEARRRAGSAMPQASAYGDPNAQQPIDELAMRREMVAQTKQAMLAKRMKSPMQQVG